MGLVRRYPFEPIELQPGLVLRLLTREEMWPLVAIVLGTGLHGDNQAAVQQRVYGWWDEAACWPLGLFWHGEVKQYECYHVAGLTMDGDVLSRRPRVATAGFMTHVDRTRPHWFYRACARVPFERLVALGVRRLLAFPRADRPDWIAHLKATYGAVEPRPGRVVGKTALIEYDLATALRACPGWPARRAAAPVTRGPLTIAACGIDEALALLPGLWGGASPERARLAERLLHERCGLDRGTLAVGTEAGVAKALWVTRDNSPLGGSACAHTTLSPWAAAPRLLHKLILEWELALGYTTASAVWEAWMWDLPRARALVPWRERRRWVHEGVEFVSTALSLADAVAIPDASWV